MTASRRVLIVIGVLLAVSVGLPWGGTVREASAQISVTAADPPTGEQGSLNLSVIIKGKGFKNGAKAKWFKTGTTDPAGVNVKSTQFVSSAQLVATIDIADAAAIADFDIVVQNTDGRTGKGTELFSVTQKIESGELSAQFRDAAGDMIRSDGLGEYTSNRITPSYPNDVVLLSSGSLSMRIQKNRQVVFEFANALRDYLVGSQVQCRVYAPVGVPPVYFYVDAPAVSVPGAPPNDIATISTGGSWKQISGGWYFDSATFNLRTMAAGQIAYVLLAFKFDTLEPADQAFFVVPGLRWLDGPPVTGAVKVTYNGVDSVTGKKSWFLESVPADDALAIYRGLASDQAIFYMPIDSVRKVHGAGTCDLGDWPMPFGLTLTTK